MPPRIDSPNRLPGKQVRLFLVDGTSGGLMTAEIMNWTGHVLKGHRSELPRIRSRAEAKRTGVYILLGESESTGEPLAYLGQSDDVSGRLVHHDAKKAFWQEVVVITSKDSNLTSAHVRYLEAQLIRLAKSIGRVPLDNGNEPSGGADLPESDASDMDYFIEQLRILLPVLGVDIFRGRERHAPTSEPVAAEALDDAVGSPIFQLTNRAGVAARAQVIDGEFTVLAGSVISASMRQRGDGASAHRQSAPRARLHAQALADAVPSASNPGLVTLATDKVFTSPSAAAAVVQGYATANGRTAWTTTDRLTYDEWERQGLA